MEKNYKMTICYDGSRYYGWEHQPDRDTIQGKLEAVLTRMCGTFIDVIGAGRTDAGVHAKAMVANAVMDTRLEPDEIRDYMNRYLPDEDVTETGIYTDANGKNWIRTGDMGYLDEDGHLIFSGRKKRIIIIAGYNIYPATIEEKVSRLDYIKEVCAVQGYDDETGKPLVKLCVSLTDPEADKDEVIEKLKKFCHDNIEGYACPRKFVVLDLLPRTKMEKIDFLKLCDKAPA